jgi:hypothetical protein
VPYSHHEACAKRMTGLMVMRAGAVKYGLEVREGLVESGESFRGLVEGDLGPGLALGNKVLLD